MSKSGVLTASLSSEPPTLDRTRRAALLGAIRLKGEASLTKHQQQSLLLQLPRELLFAVLSCLPPATTQSAAGSSARLEDQAVRAVADVRLACSALFVAAEASRATHAAAVAHLAFHTRALMSRFSPAPRSRWDSSSDADLKTTALEAAPSSPAVRVAVQALRAALAVGGRRVPHTVLDAVEKRFDPMMHRYACYVTARGVTDLPGALALVAEGQWDEVVTKAFAKPLGWGHQHNRQRGEEEKEAERDRWDARNDAWTSQDSLRLGPLKHVATEQELDAILAAAYKDAKVNRPSTSDVLLSLSQLVGVTPFMLWHDAEFSGSSPHQSKRQQQQRERFVVVGATAACVVQIEYYSNFCGGPFANYSCGMG